MESMTRGITQRIAAGEQFLEEVIQDLTEWGFSVAVNGTEHTHIGFIEKLRRSTDPTSLFIRFEPDCVVCASSAPMIPPISWYLEVKASIKLTIEKTAYEQYMKRVMLDQVVAIVFKGNQQKLWNLIQELKFIPSTEIINRFSLEKRFPVIDGWICPRESTAWRNTIRWNNLQASGTPYKHIDPKSLLPWHDFRNHFFCEVDP